MEKTFHAAYVIALLLAQIAVGGLHDAKHPNTGIEIAARRRETETK